MTRDEMKKGLSTIIQKVSSDAELVKIAAEILASMENDESTEGSKVYVATVEMTTFDGEKHYQPVVGDWNSVPTNPEDWKMMYSEDLIEVQNKARVMSPALLSAGLKLTIIPMSKEKFVKLEKDLAVLTSTVFTAVDDFMEKLTPAMTILGRDESFAEYIKAEVMQTLFSGVLSTGTGVNENGEFVSRPNDGYIEENKEYCDEVSCDGCDFLDEDGCCCCEDDCNECECSCDRCDCNEE